MSFETIMAREAIERGVITKDEIAALQEEMEFDICPCYGCQHYRCEIGFGSKTLLRGCHNGIWGYSMTRWSSPMWRGSLCRLKPKVGSRNPNKDKIGRWIANYERAEREKEAEARREVGLK